MSGLPFEDFDLGWAPGHLLRRCHQRFQALFSEAAAEFALTPQQTAVLIAVHQSPGSSFRALTARTGIDRNTLREIIARLIARGVVVRRRSARDPRCHDLRISADGLAVLLAIEDETRRVEALMLAPLAAAERADFIAAARKIARLGTDGRTS